MRTNRDDQQNTTYEAKARKPGGSCGVDHASKPRGQAPSRPGPRKKESLPKSSSSTHTLCADIRNKHARMPTKLAQTFAQVHALLLMIPRLRAHALKMRKSPNGMKIVDARHVDIPHKPQHMPAQNMHGVTEHAQRHDAQCACVPCPVSIISRRAPSVNPESLMRTPGSSTPPRPLSHLHRPRGHLRLSPDGFHVPEVPAKSKRRKRRGGRGKEMER